MYFSQTIVIFKTNCINIQVSRQYTSSRQNDGLNCSDELHHRVDVWKARQTHEFQYRNKGVSVYSTFVLKCHIVSSLLMRHRSMVDFDFGSHSMQISNRVSYLSWGTGNFYDKAFVFTYSYSAAVNYVEDLFYWRPFRFRDIVCPLGYYNFCYKLVHNNVTYQIQLKVSRHDIFDAFYLL